MKLTARDVPDAWYENKAILFESDDPGLPAVEVARATSGTIMQAPYAPDEVHSFSADLLARPDSLIIRVSQFTSILDPPTTTCRVFRSLDRGLTWSAVGDSDLAMRPEDYTLISELS